MPAPIAPLLALGALSLGASLFGNSRQNAAQKRQERANKDAARRAAIERAMGGTSFSRPSEVISAPDLTLPSLVSGLSNLGSSLYTQKMVK